MIRGYSDHAANERTFLAWLRTSIAVIAFGFVVEKFNLFALTLLDSASLDEAHRMRLERLSGSLPQGAGRAFIAVGAAFFALFVTPRGLRPRRAPPPHRRQWLRPRATPAPNRLPPPPTARSRMETRVDCSRGRSKSDRLSSPG